MHAVFWCAIFLIGCFHSIWVSSQEEGCRLVARFMPAERTNGTSANSTVAQPKYRFDEVEIFYSNADDFTITKRLGSGSYGEAYLGHNITSMQTYVIKLYRFGKLKRKKMMREILVTQSLCGSPNIIKLYHVIKQSLTGYPALVFEYARDTYYRDLYPKLTPHDVRYYMYEILKGLAFAHDRGVMHKDLKPANIMIDHDERKLKIIDWGLSQFYVQEESQSIAGSLYYKSPEMLLSYAHSEYSTDLWSLGCIFAAMLYRKSIFFTGGTPEEQLLLISQTLGTDGLLMYSRKYSMSFNESLVTEFVPQRSWESLVTDSSKPYATPDALDLLSHMLVYDHKKRISSKDALMHPYFRPLRQPAGTSNSTTTVSTKHTVDRQAQSQQRSPPPLPGSANDKELSARTDTAGGLRGSGNKDLKGNNPL